MPRIPDAEVERIKRQVSLESLVREHGVALKRLGSNLVGLCPFHDDHEPSLVITPSKNLWNCLGACQTGGSVIDWVMKTRSCDFRQAVVILRDRCGMPVRAASLAAKTATIEKCVDSSGRGLLERVVRHYQHALTRSTDALNFLMERGIRDEAALETFRLGYVDRTLQSALPSRKTRAGMAIREQLKELGILSSSGHERFAGCVVFPITGRDGTISEIYGRRIRDDVRPGTPVHMYLPGPHRGIWNVGCLGQEEIILCEAIIDALTFWVNGLRNVTCGYGVNGFTDELRTALKEAGTQHVLLAYDRDDAGDKAAAKHAADLEAMGMTTRRLLLPRGMDVNAYALKVTPANKSLENLIHQPTARHATPAQLEALETLDRDPQPKNGTKPANSPAILANPITVAKEEIAAQVDEQKDEITFQFGDRQYRVRGLSKNLSYDQMRISLLIRRGDDYHLDHIDLCNARQRHNFIKTAAEELAIKDQVIKKDLGKICSSWKNARISTSRTRSRPQKPASNSPRRRPKKPWLSSATLAWSSESWRISTLAAWWVRTPTSCWPTWPQSHASCRNPWPSSSRAHPLRAKPRSWKPSWRSCRMNTRSSIPR